MILVACECRPTSKGLLAVGIRAFVWSLARVYPPVPSQGARITERLEIDQLLNLVILKRLTFPHLSHMCGFSPV